MHSAYASTKSRRIKPFLVLGQLLRPRVHVPLDAPHQPRHHGLLQAEGDVHGARLLVEGVAVEVEGTLVNDGELLTKRQTVVLTGIHHVWRKGARHGEANEELVIVFINGGIK